MRIGNKQERTREDTKQYTPGGGGRAQPGQKSPHVPKEGSAGFRSTSYLEARNSFRDREVMAYCIGLIQYTTAGPLRGVGRGGGVDTTESGCLAITDTFGPLLVWGVAVGQNSLQIREGGGSTRNSREGPSDQGKQWCKAFLGNGLCPLSGCWT